jgi:hypothetical protein
MIELEHIPADEAANIAKIAQLTIKQLERRYSDKPPVLRGVHAKGHGCVKAKFKVDDNLPEDLRVGVLASPGREYEAVIRFSNASVSGTDPDSKLDKKLPMHGSRGMAVKLLGVAGTPPTEGPLTQDFVMINQPMFAFANVEDYRALSEVLLRDEDKAEAFFTTRTKLTDENGKPALAAQRAVRTFGIVRRIQSSSLTADPAAYQTPPASPLDNQYSSAAPFLFGEDRAMKFSAKPVAPSEVESPNISDPDYLCTALRKRLAAPDAGDTVFKFQVQVRTADDLAGHIDTDIEDATVEWPGEVSVCECGDDHHPAARPRDGRVLRKPHLLPLAWSGRVSPAGRNQPPAAARVRGLEP